MTWIQKTLDSTEKLTVLSQDSQYDLACACGMHDEDRRHRSKDERWIYPVALPQRRSRTFLFKTLISNVCVNDCKYCPLRADRDPRRCTLEKEELTQVFFEYLKAGRVMGLFLSSGLIGTPDQTMERLNAIAEIVRKKQFRGYMHLKIIPGASEAAIEKALSLASTVSLNIETAGEAHFKKLSAQKNYLDDIIQPLKFISRITQAGSPYSKVRQNTQFVVGASDESDREIMNYSWGLYKRLGLERVYFSAYQRGLGDESIPGEQNTQNDGDLLTREHRLYQGDWLMRKYGFQLDDFSFEANGNLDLRTDPKETWARRHPEFFPIDVNFADKYELLRVPGLGPVTVERILAFRRNHSRVRSLRDIGKPGKLLQKAAGYIRFS